ncbi:hypothetical protein Tco_1060743, partial [Tanacetum coccineum]
ATTAIIFAVCQANDHGFGRLGGFSALGVRLAQLVDTESEPEEASSVAEELQSLGSRVPPMGEEFKAFEPSGTRTDSSHSSASSDSTAPLIGLDFEESSSPVARLEAIRGIFINQSKYAKEILKKFDLHKSDPIDTPMVERTKLDEDLSGPRKKHREAVLNGVFDISKETINMASLVSKRLRLALNSIRRCRSCQVVRTIAEDTNPGSAQSSLVIIIQTATRFQDEECTSPQKKVVLTSGD